METYYYGLMFIFGMFVGATMMAIVVLSAIKNRGVRK